MDSVPIGQRVHRRQEPNQDMTNSASSYSVWNNFFLMAGIPSKVAHDYAVTFSQHRIRIDMLKEITKDILLDMGIKAMGDIIAILRHAKDVCTQNELNVDGADHMNDTDLTSRASVVKKLSDRTPIATTRTSANSISSLVGNKVQSKISLSSGALSRGNLTKTTTKISTGDKRPSSTISSSLAKRLRPASTETPIELREKTLTVRYPSKTAIAKAQQRISSLSSTANTTTGSSNVKSRLGSVDSGKARHESSNHQHSNNASYTTRHRDNGNGFVSKSSSEMEQSRRQGAYMKPQKKPDHHPSQRDGSKFPANRPKSTVFSRLGEGER